MQGTEEDKGFGGMDAPILNARLAGRWRFFARFLGTAWLGRGFRARAPRGRVTRMSHSEAFPRHVFDALGVDPRPFTDKIRGDIMVVDKAPPAGPRTIMTLGASRLPTDSDESVELAVEVLDGQEGAAFVAFDEVREPDATLAGHVRTLRLLTDAEDDYVQARGWDGLVAAAGSVDALLDARGSSAVGNEAAGGARTMAGEIPVFLSKLHEAHPPRWVTFAGADLRSVVGLEPPEYMNDFSNHEVISRSEFVHRFPFVADFVNAARPGQTGFFADQSGAFVIEDD